MAMGIKSGGTADDREAARLIDALAAHGRGEAPVDLEPALEAELVGYLALTRRIGALDDGPVAPSVRSAVMNEAARVTAERAEAAGSTQQGWLSLLLALLRPGPVLAMTALAAVAVALSLRSKQPEVGHDGPEMVAMQASGRTVASVDDPAGAAPASPEALPAATVPAAAPAEAAAAALGTAVVGEAAAGAAAPSNQEEGLGAPIADARALPARPRTAIAASPASLGPLPEAPGDAALAQAAQAERGAQSPAAQAAQAEQLAGGGARAREDAGRDLSYGKGQQSRYVAAPRAEAQRLNDMESAAIEGAPVESAAADTVAQRRESAEAKQADYDGKKTVYAGRANAPSPSQPLAKTKEANAAPAPAETPRAAGSGAPRSAETSEVERLRKELAVSTSMSARVQVLEKLAAAEERAGDDLAAARTRKELAAARSELASEGARTKAASKRVESTSAPSK